MNVSAESHSTVESPKPEKQDRRARQAEHYRKNRERILARMKAHYYRNRERISRRHAERYKKNKAAIDARNKAYRLSHLEKIANLAKAWRKKNPSRMAAAARRWYAKNRERSSAHHKKYAQEHPEIYVLAAHKRRALKRRSAINLAHLKEWMKGVRSKPFATCYYCQQQISTKEIHFDHIEPLSKGGPHTVENLCVSCGPCNQSKHDKGVRTWVRIGQQVLEL